MRPTVYTIDNPGPGKLSTMGKPRGGDWLEAELEGLRELGVDVLVSALSADEAYELGLVAEGLHATAAGLEFMNLPIPDRDVPELSTALPLLRRASRALMDEAHVVIHCRYGIGRASVLAAALLVMQGVDPYTAWERVAGARDVAVPDTTAQRQWVFDLADHLGDR